MKSRGLTIIELLVSVTLISIVMVLVFSILIDIRVEESKSSFSSSDVLNRNIITKNIQESLIEKDISNIELISNNGDIQEFLFHHSDLSTSTLIVDDNSIMFNDEKWILNTTVYDLDKTCFKIDDRGNQQIMYLKFFPKLENTSYEETVFLDIEIFYIGDYFITIDNPINDLPICTIISI